MATTYGTFVAQHPIRVAETEEEAVNHVLTGTALAARATEDEVLFYAVTPAAPPTEPPPIEPPPGEPTETAIVQWPVAVTDTDIPLTTIPTTVVVGSEFLIDLEYMVVIDISNADNPAVNRGSRGSIVASHEAGALVTIWGPATKSAQTRHAKTTATAVVGPRDETKREEAKREREEERREEEAEDRADAKAAKVKGKHH